jgi:DNA polymerase-1
MPLKHSFSGTQVVMIDGSSFMYRAFYAIKPMHSPDGIPVNAVFGFCRMFKKIIDTLQPDHILIAWDSKGGSKRTKVYQEYKAKRLAFPQDLVVQKELIENFAEAIGVTQLAEPGYEADDLLYTATNALKNKVDRVVIVTNDKDLAQLVGGNVTIYDGIKESFIDRDGVITKFGIPPERLLLYFSLRGDTSDNIPGVKGIGEKTAVKLASQYVSLDDLYAHLNDIIPEGVRLKLRENEELARLSARLFELEEVPYPIHLKDLKFSVEQWYKARDFFVALGFSSLIKNMPAPVRTETFAQRYKVHIKTVTTVKELLALREALQQVGECAIDTETSVCETCEPIGSELVGISFCYAIGMAYYLPLAHTGQRAHITRDVVLHQLRPILENPEMKIYFHNAKFDLLVLRGFGFTNISCAFDTMIAANLIAGDEERVGLKFLSLRHLNQEMMSYKDVMASGNYKSFEEVPLEQAADYAAADAHQTWQLVAILQKALREQCQEKVYYDLELPLMFILFGMEREGITLDVPELQRAGIYVNKSIVSLEAQIRASAGPAAEGINLGSPRQIEKLLFIDLGLTPIKKTSSGSYSTSREVLLELTHQHPIARLLLEHREMMKLKSTYIDALPKSINPATSRIHTNFNQIGVATGRLASSDPNMQNIPTDAFGGHSIRSAFKAPPGCQFISADYSQIELRILAHVSQDKHLCDEFLRDADIHAATAAHIFNIDPLSVTHEQRQLGKRINFSILYGLTPYGLSRELHISPKDAKTYIDAYFANYPQVGLWMEQVIEETKKCGYVTTLGGRRRYIPGIYENNRHLYELARRVAINTVAQGTAAEIVKKGMLELDRVLSAEYPEVRLVLQIHDELLISVPDEMIKAVASRVTAVLESVVQWEIPLKVTTRVGRDWGAVTK